MPYKSKEADRVFRQARKDEYNARRRARYHDDPLRRAARNEARRLQHLKDPTLGHKEYLQTKNKHANEPDFWRWRAIYAQYGLTKQAWLDMFAAQGFCCAVCGTKEPGAKRGWHTHHTGIKKLGTLRVPGILCHHCNLVLHRKMTPEILRRLAAFAENGGL